MKKDEGQIEQEEEEEGKPQACVYMLPMRVQTVCIYTLTHTQAVDLSTNIEAEGVFLPLLQSDITGYNSLKYVHILPHLTNVQLLFGN